jgi:hypothetical protein
MGLNKRQYLQIETWRLIPNTARYILEARNPGSEGSRGKLLMTNHLSQETENKIIMILNTGPFYQVSTTRCSCP